ncbi:Transmembrane domain of the Epidermal Growth Factor Receptor family of Tyrosine Kinase [Pyrenophora seminiperda CCB06]|uniref:Transmembrane domain of the Epidermal Growth Factor Receptor family of Tyrosine Kinase n=1 Tax=Pyrenophora seminiperda CCB06 TaxID=1302712 RepID=A0A3M7MED2_9PLEO|nr:Transmembrane domain of the Epidermal Growth Factor Receptor family of Tyrosine Kinase [Pyrenophora seminiperda CCB06]
MLGKRLTYHLRGRAQPPQLPHSHHSAPASHPLSTTLGAFRSYSVLCLQCHLGASFDSADFWRSPTWISCRETALPYEILTILAERLPGTDWTNNAATKGCKWIISGSLLGHVCPISSKELLVHCQTKDKKLLAMAFRARHDETTVASPGLSIVGPSVYFLISSTTIIMANSSYYDFHCEAGAKWYACAAGSKFVGCCTTDPCSNGCAQGNIRPGAYNITHYGEFPDGSCGTSSNFFSCIAGPSFWGCCKSNPCAATPPSICPPGDLVPAFMDRPEQFKAYVEANSTSDTSSKSNTGAIIGGVVGGVFVIGIIGAIIIFMLRRRRNRKRGDGYMGAAAMVPMMKGEKHDEHGNSMHYSGLSPPPTYTSPHPDQNIYQQGFPVKGQQSYHQYANHASEPQELPADISSQRYSELPADISNGAISELASPEISPMPLQSEYSNDMAKRTSGSRGLGIS